MTTDMTLRERLRGEHSYYCMFLNMETCGQERPLSYPLWLLRWGLPDEIHSRWLGLVCRVRGHDMVDHSHGGPDSGYESAECRRCGWGYHVQMY